jgi:hypothetical protein
LRTALASPLIWDWDRLTARGAMAFWEMSLELIRVGLALVGLACWAHWPPWTDAQRAPSRARVATS